MRYKVKKMESIEERAKKYAISVSPWRQDKGECWDGDTERGYIKGATDQDPISRAEQKKIDIEKAWKWINNKVELSYTDYDNFLKTMEG